MRFLIYCLFLILPWLGFSQIDNGKTSFSLPAIEDDKEVSPSFKAKPLLPETDNTPNNSPNLIPELKFPKKEFSMFPQEEFGNPAEQYTKRFDKIEEETRPEGYGVFGHAEDVYWGDYTTTSEFVKINLRDGGLEIDGDYLEISVNDEIFVPRVFLNDGFTTFILKLEKGFNKIEFRALNNGAFPPNTALYKIIDEDGTLISYKNWSLYKDIKVTFIIVKE